MTKIFLDYTREELDAQYNNRARVPDFQRIVDRWTRESEAVTAAGYGKLDIAYGENARNKLDIFPVNAGKPSRSLVFVHGGYWQALGRETFRYMAPAINAAGMACVLIGYPLAPDVRVGDIVDSVRQALAWLWRNGDQYGVDPDEIHVSGHSAGGHLTAMMMGTVWPTVAEDLPQDLVKSGTAISGLYDLEPVRLTYLNDSLGLDAPEAASLSPVNHPPPVDAGPLLAVVGADESDEFRRQQADYLELLDGHGSNAIGFELPGANHFTIIDGLGDPDSLLLGAIRSMVFGDT